jgi:putative endonuclease
MDTVGVDGRFDSRGRLGARGEKAAADLYQKAGYALVERNYRCPLGELDLIVMKGSVLVFSEVKTRRTDRHGLPSEAVRATKQARIKRLAAHWMREHKPGAVEVRFDVVSVIVTNVRTEATLVANAF